MFSKSQEQLCLSSKEIHTLLSSNTARSLSGILDEEKDRKIHEAVRVEEDLAKEERRWTRLRLYKYEEIPSYLQDNEFIRGRLLCF